MLLRIIFLVIEPFSQELREKLTEMREVDLKIQSLIL